MRSPSRLISFWLTLIAAWAAIGSVAKAATPLQIPGLYMEWEPGSVDDLKKQIRSGSYVPRTCVASLIADSETNDAIFESAALFLEEIGYSELEDTKALFEFKVGLEGLQECIAGPYEDVTIIGHSFSGSDTGVILQERVRDKDGVLEREVSRVPPEFFRQFTSGRITTGNRLRQITLIVCDSEKVIRVDQALLKFIRQFGLNIRAQPYDLIESLKVGLRKKPRTGNLLDLMIADNAQPEWMSQVGCLVTSTMVLLWDSGDGYCLRGRYKVSVSSLSFGFKYSSDWIRFSPRQVDEQFSLKSSSVIDLELSFGYSLRLNLNSRVDTFAKTGGYGVSAGLFETVEVRNNKHCFNSSPRFRSICFGDKEALARALEYDVPIDEADNLGRTSLTLSLISGDLDKVELLVEKGADPNTQDHFGMTAVHYGAALSRRWEVSAILNGSILLDLNLTDDSYGNTALHWAAIAVDKCGQSLSLARNLVRYKSDFDPTLKNDVGQSVFDLIKQKRYGNMSELRKTAIWKYGRNFSKQHGVH